MINRINLVEHQHAQTNFTGYGKVVRVCQHKASEHFYQKMFELRKEPLLDSIASVMRKPVEELKDELHITPQIEENMLDSYKRTDDLMWKIAENSNEETDQATIGKTYNTFKTELKKILEKNKFIDKKNRFNSLKPKNVIIEAGEDFIDDDLSKLGDTVTLRGNINFDNAYGDAIFLTNVKNKKLKVKANTVVLTNSTVGTVDSEIGAYGRNVQAGRISSKGEINIMGKNKISTMLAQENIDISGLTSNLVRSKSGSIKIWEGEDNFINDIEARKDVISDANLNCNGEIFTYTGDIKLNGTKNIVGEIIADGAAEANNITVNKISTNHKGVKLTGIANKVKNKIETGQDIEAENLTAKIICSYEGNIKLNGQKNNVKNIFAHSSVEATNLTAKTVDSIYGPVKYKGDSINVRQTNTEGYIEGQNIQGEILKSKNGDITILGNNNKINNIRAKYFIILRNITADTVESVYSPIYIYGDKNIVKEIKTPDTLSALNLEYTKIKASRKKIR